MTVEEDMPITLGSNIASLKTQQQLAKTSVAVSTIFERLSSGLRINHTADDPAGLALSSSLNINSRILGQSIRNINDGISLLNVAEGAGQEIYTIVTRITELAEQAANGIYSSKQRMALDKEAQALADEYARIVSDTKYNGITLLNGEATTLQLQIGANGATSSILEVGIPIISSTTIASGEFSSPVEYTLTGRPLLLTVADFNGDGADDILTGGDSGGSLTLQLSNGDGTFRYSLLGASNVTGLSNGVDLNGDGKLDFYGRNAAGNIVFLGNGNGTFSFNNISGPVAYRTTFADLNNDGKYDLLGTDSTTNSLYVRLGNGNGSFGGVLTTTTGGGMGDKTLSVADIDGDDVLDVLTLHTTGYEFRKGLADGTFAAATLIAETTPFDQTIGDVNSDGILDLVTGSGGSSGSIYLRLGNGNGTFKAGTTIVAHNGRITLVDLNEDGNLDLLRRSYTSDGRIYTALGNGDGTFRAQLSTAAASSTDAYAVGDFNRDSALDLAATTYSNSTTAVFLSVPRTSVALENFSLLTAENARAALNTLQLTLNNIATFQGVIGTSQTRLTTALSNNSSLRENYQLAASRILDADIATEASSLIRQQVLQRAATAVLTQANLNPELALKLLRI